MNAVPSTVRWDDLRLLLEVARAGSLLAAGRDLGLATSTLSRRLTALEATAGTLLLERRNDGVRLTDAGARLAETVRDVDLQLRARLRELPSIARELKGTIRVATGDGFARTVLEAIKAFRGLHPGVLFELVLDGRPLDLVRREADIAIRTGPRHAASLVYRSLGRLPHGLWAAPAYVQQHGLPRSLGDLAHHDFVGYAAPLSGLPAMHWLRAHGATRFAVRASQFTAVLHAAQLGIGIAPLPDQVADGLTRVLPAHRPDAAPVWLAFHPDAKRAAHIRAFIEAVTTRFRERAATATASLRG